MNFIEALELLKQGYNVGEYKGNRIYRMYSNGRIYFMKPETSCAASVITSFSESEWMRVMASVENNQFKAL